MLTNIGGQVTSAQEELDGAVQAKFSETEQKQATASVLLTEQLGQTLQETNARIDQANKEVHDKIKGATKADAQRDQQAQMELMMEESKIHKYETDFGPKYEEMLGG